MNVCWLNHCLILKFLIIAEQNSILYNDEMYKSNAKNSGFLYSPDNQKSETTEHTYAHCRGSFLVESDSRWLVVARIKSAFRQTTREDSNPAMRSDSGQARSRKPITKHGEDVLHWLRVYHTAGQRMQSQRWKVVERKFERFLTAMNLNTLTCQSGCIAVRQGTVFAIDKSCLWQWLHWMFCFLKK